MLTGSMTKHNECTGAVSLEIGITATATKQAASGNTAKVECFATAVMLTV